ncbi:18101_t:CDS:2 [Rhizophagus irregularis]|nr:18101_t:CDS:2 [Rhizophagus irregularis]
MSSEQGTPLITRRRPQKLCPKETNNLDKIEEVIDNFHENPLEEELSKILLELT